MKIHDDIESWIAGAFCGALSDDEQKNFEQHLAACADCRSLYEAEKKMDTKLHHTFSKWKPDEDFEQRVVAKFREHNFANDEVSDKANEFSRKPNRFFSALVRLVQSRPVQAAFSVLVLAALVETGSLITGESLTTNFSYPKRVITFSANQPTKAEQNQLAKRPAGKTSQETIFYGGGIPQHQMGQNGSVKSKAAYTRRMPAQPINSAEPRAMAGMGGAMIFGARKTRNVVASSAAANPPLVKKATTASISGAVDNRKLIRNATLDFVVANYEAAADTIRKITNEEQGSIDTNDSSRGANGKLRGTIVVKIPPENLNQFLLKIRALGDLKNQQIKTEDVTKSYFDTSARLRNSKVMEQRLLEMLKKKTGNVKDLLEVEKELGHVRGQIEVMQGQLKYWDSLIAYATVTITLSEKDLHAPAAYLLREQSQLSLFAANVEKTFADAKTEAKKADAQIVDSHVSRDENGRVTATLTLLIASEKSALVISEIKTLGRIQNFTQQTRRIARGGNDQAGNSKSAKTKRDKVQFTLTIFPDQERVSQRTGLTVQTSEVAKQAAQIKREAVSEGVQVKTSTFSQSTNGQETAVLEFRLPFAKTDAFLAQIKALGKVTKFNTQRSDNLANSEPAPTEIALTLQNQGNIVAPDHGVFATIRHTLAQGFSALMWSLRMIVVSLAFIAPWAIAFVIVLWIFIRHRKSKK